MLDTSNVWTIEFGPDVIYSYLPNKRNPVVINLKSTPPPRLSSYWEVTFINFNCFFKGFFSEQRWQNNNQVPISVFIFAFLTYTNSLEKGHYYVFVYLRGYTAYYIFLKKFGELRLLGS